jgi:hypothetical protein
MTLEGLEHFPQQKLEAFMAAVDIPSPPIALILTALTTLRFLNHFKHFSVVAMAPPHRPRALPPRVRR